MTTIAQNSLQSWVLTARPKTLGAISCPVFIGSALAFADGQFQPSYFWLTLICAILLQVLANVINDYGDFIKGSDTKMRLGPPRAMQMGWITMDVMKKGIGTILLLTVSLGFFLVLRGGLPILIIGVIGIFLCGWYTLGKRPLAYIGFSELVVFWIFGPLAVFFTYYVQTLSFSKPALLGGIAPGLLSMALILTNNVRDVVEDQKNNKRTVAVRFGSKSARVAIIGATLFAFLLPLVLVIFYSFSSLILFSSAVFVLPSRHFPMIWQDEISARFNLMLAALGKSLYLFGVLMSLGIICGAA